MSFLAKVEIVITRVFINHGEWKSRITRHSLTFQPGINIIVGSNGCGKSSLWKALNSRTHRIVTAFDEADSRVQEKPGIYLTLTNPKVRFIVDEFEDMPNHRGHLAQESSEMKFQLWSKFHSHGEINIERVNRLEVAPELGPEGEKFIHYLDEPEGGLDQKAIMKAREIFTGYVAKGHQLLVATHHPLFWTMPDAHIICLDKDDNYVENALVEYRQALQ